VAGTTSAAGALVLRPTTDNADSTTTLSTYQYSASASNGLNSTARTRRASISRSRSRRGSVANTLTLNAAIRDQIGPDSLPWHRYNAGSILAATGGDTIKLHQNGFVDKTSASVTYNPASQTQVAFSGAAALQFGFVISAQTNGRRIVADRRGFHRYAQPRPLANSSQYSGGSYYLAARAPPRSSCIITDTWM